MISALDADGGRAGAQDISRSVWELFPCLDPADELCTIYFQQRSPKNVHSVTVAIFWKCIMQYKWQCKGSLVSVKKFGRNLYLTVRSIGENSVEETQMI
jgi:hypothetical protein